MKPVAVAQKTSIEFGGLVETTAFTIKANAKAFRVLIDGLYSDKVRAIIRELSSNAFDAHRAAGNDQPFEITLPTRWEPTFMIRDFGTGLDHDGVMSLYTTIFESTKEGTNNEVGRFGLGSKSPFAYTDTFTVRSIQNGMARSYGAYIAADGVPQIALMGTTETDAATGFEVSFPVQMQDINAFADKLRRVGRGFDQKPIVLGNSDFQWETFEALCSGNGWRLLDAHSYDHAAQAKQGCVIYPIDPHSIGGLTETQKQLLMCPLYIDFAIGEVDITPSRESLSYDDTTQANIAQQIARIEQEIISTYDHKITEARTYWEAQAAFVELTSGNLPEAIKGVFRRHAKWRGRRVHVETPVVISKYKDLEMSCTSSSDIRRRKRLHFTNNFRTYVGPGSGTALIFQDTSKRLVKAAPRIQHYALKQGCGVVWFRGDINSIAAKRLWLKLGRPPFVNAADLEIPPHESAPRTKTARFKTYEFGKWQDAEADPEAGGIYVDLRNNEAFTSEGAYLGNYAYERIVDVLVELGHVRSTNEVYGIPGTYKGLPDRHEGWTNLLDLAEEVIKANLDEKTYYAARDAQTTLLALGRGNVDTLLELLAYIQEACPLPATSPAAQTMDRVADLEAVSRAGDAQRKVVELARLLSGRNDGYEPVLDEDVVREANGLLARYPMIHWALNQHGYLRGGRPSNSDIQMLREYINSVDAVSYTDDKGEEEAA